VGDSGASHGATEIELTAVIHSLAMYLIIEALRTVGEVRKSGRRQVKQTEGVGKSSGEIWKKKASLASFRDSCMALWKRPQLSALAKGLCHW
jgi:hypothetical protein